MSFDLQVGVGAGWSEMVWIFFCFRWSHEMLEFSKMPGIVSWYFFHQKNLPAGSAATPFTHCWRCIFFEFRKGVSWSSGRNGLQEMGIFFKVPSPWKFNCLPLKNRPFLSPQKERRKSSKHHFPGAFAVKLQGGRISREISSVMMGWPPQVKASMMSPASGFEIIQKGWGWSFKTTPLVGSLFGVFNRWGVNIWDTFWWKKTPVPPMMQETW